MPIISRENTVDDLVKFIKSYAGEPKNEYKVPFEQIPDYLPRQLQIIYHEFGNYPSYQQAGTLSPTLPLNNDDTSHLFHNQDALVYFDNLREENGKVIFAWENQGNWEAETDARKDDPPVYSDAYLLWSEDTGKGKIKVCDHLSHFLATFCLQELVYGSRRMYSFKEDYDQNQVNQAIEKCKAVWVDGKYVYENNRFSYYLTEDNSLLMVIDGKPQYISSNENSNSMIEDSVWSSQVEQV